MLEFDLKKVSLKELVLLGTLIGVIFTFKVHVEDRLAALEKHADQIEAHLQYDDQRINKTNDEINILERQVDWERGRLHGAHLDLNGAKRSKPSAMGAGYLPPSWRGPLTRQEVHSRSGSD